MTSKQTGTSADFTTNTPQRLRLWDWPTRIFHWTLVLAVSSAIITAELGGNLMVWHGRAGIVIIGLLVFRLVWGVFGSTYARFAQFFPTPAKLRAYVRGQWRGIGHNPLGALSVFALLGLLLLQASSGLFANDDIDFTGPLFNLVSQERSNWLTGWHQRIGDVLFWLIGLHVVAVLFYVLIKKKNLLGPMVTGWTEEAGLVPEQAAKGGNVVVLVLALVLAFMAMWLASGTFAL